MNKFIRIADKEREVISQTDYRAESDAAAEKLLQEIQKATEYARYPYNETKTDSNGTAIAPAPYLNGLYREFFQNAGNFSGLPSYKPIVRALSALSKQMNFIGQEIPKNTPAQATNAPAQAINAPAQGPVPGQEPQLMTKATPAAQTSATPQTGTATQTTATPQTGTAAPATSVNYFAKAGLDPNGRGYTGKADQNEKLRQAIDSVRGTKSRTFYDAYNAAFGGWNHHPSDRIKNLMNGAPPKPAPQVQTPAPVAGNTPPAPTNATPPNPTQAPQQTAGNTNYVPQMSGGYSSPRYP